MPASQPVLIIVSGPPAAGKSSIVEGLARALGLPLFTKDEMKERFADALGEGAFDHASELGKGSQLQLIATARELVVTGNGVVIESFFHKGITEPQLQPLILHANAVLVHITAQEDVLVQRYAERMDDPARHEIHNTDSSPEELRTLLREGLGDPLDLDCPSIVLDSTNAEIEINDVVSMVQETLARAAN